MALTLTCFPQSFLPSFLPSDCQVIPAHCFRRIVPNSYGRRRCLSPAVFLHSSNGEWDLEYLQHFFCWMSVFIPNFHYALQFWCGPWFPEAVGVAQRDWSMVVPGVFHWIMSCWLRSPSWCSQNSRLSCVTVLEEITKIFGFSRWWDAFGPWCWPDVSV